MTRSIVLLTAIFFSYSSLAQSTQRGREEDMFGGSSGAPVKSQAIPDAVKALKDAFESGTVQDNPLQIGGVYYQRLLATGQDGVKTGDTPLSMPLQFDLYFDVRPSDRVRGF